MDGIRHTDAAGHVHGTRHADGTLDTDNTQHTVGTSPSIAITITRTSDISCGHYHAEYYAQMTDGTWMVRHTDVACYVDGTRHADGARDTDDSIWHTDGIRHMNSTCRACGPRRPGVPCVAIRLVRLPGAVCRP